MDSAKKWPQAWRRLSLLVALVTAALAGLGGIVVGGQSASASVRHSIPFASSVQQAMPGTWTGQDLPAGVNNLIDVSCPTSYVCAATAQTSFSGSMLVSTTNSGAIWTARAFPPDASGNPSAQFVACPAANRCYVTFAPAGNRQSGGVLLTTDLGLDWSHLTMPAGATNFDHIACSSTEVCYADTNLGIIGTNDGGATWSVQATFLASVLSCPTATTTCFALASGQQLYVTSDSGATWSPVSTLPGSIGREVVEGADISCPDANDCFVAGAIVANATTGTPMLWVSHDGGATWSTPTAPYPNWPGPPPGSTQTDLGGTFQSIDCPTAQACFVRGQLHGEPIADATTDGGSVWTAQNAASGAMSPPLADPYSMAVSCPSSNQCFAVGALGVAGYSPTTPSTFVAMAATPSGSGYTEVSSDGTVFRYGDARFYGSMSGLPLTAPVSGMAATPDGKGYWLVASDGGLFAFGDATFYGSTGALVLNRPIVGMTSTADGKGYWLVASDGGVFAFGDATFHGSMGGSALNKPVVGMAVDQATGGYWLVAADGGVFSFAAPFLGSTGNTLLNQPVVGIESVPSGVGYRFVAADGGVFSFGLSFFGSMGGIPINRPMVGIAFAGSTGYWTVAADGGIFSFGSAQFLGSPV